MAIDLTARIAHEPTDHEVATVLGKLQGNILKGHGRDHVSNIFFHFTVSPENIRAVMIPLAQRIVTSALKQHQQARQMTAFGVPGEPFGSLLLTAKGYRALGFTEAQMAKAFPEGAPGEGKPFFRVGMKACRAELGDPDPSRWEAPFQDEIHLLVLLADDDEQFLLRETRSVLNQLSSIGRVVGVEHGHALRNADGLGTDHFGFVNGRSQPIFLKPQSGLNREGNAWNPIEPLECVLVHDEIASDEHAFGSFYVFRKLEQDVFGFRVRERELAEALGLGAAGRERAGALAVGRFRDGTPLALSPVPIGVADNDFRYDGTLDNKCPYHAHIRKMNPRGDQSKLKGVPESVERSRRLARRGIPYGKINHQGTSSGVSSTREALDGLPRQGVGLLFACFQSDIREHFGFLSARAKFADFVQFRTGQDPIAAAPEPVPSDPQKWPVRWGEPLTEPFYFGHFVTLKGGEFFFAPSLPFLNRLVPNAV